LDAARRNLTNVGAQPSSDEPAECVAEVPSRTMLELIVARSPAG
jgi:hypothetical protein